MDHEQTWSEFRDLVTMAPAELDKWLKTPESRDAGQHQGGGESTGHASGRRHLAQRPSGDVADTTWRHSLMNWGHDPLSGHGG
ncbi:DUF3140 domain-containing protein [Streptomyces sp. NBC_00028]|uniref:DUF3140 domain-containing protein n=1 Tax=Streptomyces sp. NBC_00028 TaxID=2975624 RepID=UPI003246B0E3